MSRGERGPLPPVDEARGTSRAVRARRGGGHGQGSCIGISCETNMPRDARGSAQKIARAAAGVLFNIHKRSVGPSTRGP